ncbi:MAG: pyridoxal-dependent decarboxylase [bacterium]|nr:pyridoxal-dependent decarboxylase [bacterium]
MSNENDDNLSDTTRISDLSKPITYLNRVREQFAIGPIKALSDLLEEVEDDLQNVARVPGKYNKDTYSQLLEKYTAFPVDSSNDPTNLVRDISKDLFGGVPLWRSPNLQYNIGAAVNRVSSALYSLALDLNIFNINDGLSGNTIIAEHAVTQILSELADVDHKNSCGFFTFGGTATNLYAIKLAVAKIFPQSRKDGIPHNIKIAITEDSHFSHLNALNWLGVGVGNALVIKASTDRTSNLQDAEEKLRAAIEAGYKIPVIVINGGTTYDNAIDDIDAFVLLRDSLIKIYGLDYIPQIHVDSVIGWAWLMFKDYDFEKNTLGIESNTLVLLKKQYNKIRKVNKADSWGIDFHKGVGSCPIPCSLVMINKAETASFLSYNEKVDTHQLAREFSEFSPVDYTLETSRPAGAALAALGAIHALGKTGYQAHLGNLVQLNQLLRQLLLLKKRNDIGILNKNSPGYVTMIRIYPPGLAQVKDIETSDSDKDAVEYTEKVNVYMKSFFKFDMENRMKYSKGVEYSYSSKYIPAFSGAKMGALKFYPTSPYICAEQIQEAVEILLRQKDTFDSMNGQV